MNCQQCQKRLMTAERPEFPVPEVEAHLAECSGCREFQRQLLTIEANVSRVPVPPSDAKARLLRTIVQPAAATPARAAAPAPTPQILRLPTAGDSRTRPLGQWLHRAKWTGAAAAAVVLIACGIWLGIRMSGNATPDNGLSPDQAKGPGPTPKTQRSKNPFDTTNGKNKKDDSKEPAPVVVDASPLVAKLMEADLKLAEAETPRERIEALADLADLLQQETRLLSKSAAPLQLNKLAGLYKQVIQDGVVAQARVLPMEQRKEVLQSLAVQLVKTKNDAERLMQTTPQSAEALRTIALAANDGDIQLQRLMQEAGE